MKTLNSFLLAALLALTGTSSLAQMDDMPPLTPERMKEIKAQKTAYLTTKLDLTSEEAQRFWPIYNEFDEAREKLRREMRDLHKSVRDQELTDARAREVITKSMDVRGRELDLEKSYNDRFIKSIGAVKTVQLVRAEHDFQREVIRRFKERMEERRGDRPGPPRRQ